MKLWSLDVQEAAQAEMSAMVYEEELQCNPLYAA
jgi:hypothetical protein